MPTREQVWTALVLLVVAIWGGVVSYFRKVSNGLVHSWRRATLEVVTSAGAGSIIGMLCYEAGWSFAWSVAFAGIGGHMGAAAIDFGEELLKSAMRAAAGRGPKG